MLRNKKLRNKPFGVFGTMFNFMGIQPWVWSYHSRPFCSFSSWKPVNPKGNQSWIFTWRIDAEAEALILWACDVKSQLTGKKPWCWERLRAGGEGVVNDEMIGWHHWLNGHEFEQALGNREGTGKPSMLQSMRSQRFGLNNNKNSGQQFSWLAVLCI